MEQAPSARLFANIRGPAAGEQAYTRKSDIILSAWGTFLGGYL